MRHAIHTAYKSTAELFIPVLKTSSFKDKGVLTPDEFVASGDHLVRICPTWSWQAGDPAKRKDYLPKDKQYLMTRNVPSNRRAAAVEEYGGSAEELLEGIDGEEDWVAPPPDSHGEAIDSVDVPSTDATAGPKAVSKGAASQAGGQDAVEDDDDIPDIDAMVLKDEEEDEATVQPAAATEEDDGIVRTRTYDLIISYDKYYQVPRFWLVGYDEKRQPLNNQQILEDVSEEHARKTITVDPFPHGNFTAASIHPCKHSLVMKKLVSIAAAGGKEFQVSSYLLYFLKFIASVIPTIEYDYTMAVGL